MRTLEEIRSKWSARVTQHFLMFCFDLGSRVLLQIFYFVIMSRAIGASGLGNFASLSALTVFIACFSGLGAEYLLIRRVSSGLSGIREEFGHCISMTLVTALPLLLLAEFISSRLGLSGISSQAIMFVAVADILLNRMVVIAATCLYSSGRVLEQVLLNLAANASKIAYAWLGVALSGSFSVEDWCVWYVIASATSATCAILVAIHHIGAPVFRKNCDDIAEGFLYCLEFASLAAFRDLDKPVVNRMLGSVDAGLYTLAFRIVDTSCVPIRALLQATYLRYFSLMVIDRASTLRFARRNAMYMIIISIAVALIDIFISKFIGYLLGEQFTAAGSAICIMSIYPLAIGITGVFADFLRALGAQRARLALQAASFLIYLPAIYYGSLLDGLSGAARSRVIVQVLVMGATWTLAEFLGRHPCIFVNSRSVQNTKL